jgi:cellobiose-specific phosphotransferase system component IIA
VKKKATSRRNGKKTAKKAVAKTSTRTVKKAVRKTSVVSSPIQEYEQTIAKARTELGKAHTKAVAQCQKPVEKLQKQLDRDIVKQKTLREKKAAATQRAAEKGTLASKNQAARAREALQVIDEKIKEVRADLNAAKLALTSSKSTQKKFVASEKQQEKFERDWIKVSTPKRKIRKRTRKAAAIEIKEEVSAPTMEEGEVTPVPLADNDLA